MKAVIFVRNQFKDTVRLKGIGKKIYKTNYVLSNLTQNTCLAHAYSLICIHTHSYKDDNKRRVTKILMLSSEFSKFPISFLIKGKKVLTRLSAVLFSKFKAFFLN